MFIYSFKSPKRKVVISTILLIGVVFLGFCFFRKSSNNAVAFSSMGKYSTKAKSNADRVEFLFQFGWEVTNEPLEVCEVVIPSKFNQTYENYNNIQKEQGLDLSKFSGMSCKRYTYEVLNYENACHGVRANLLVLNDKIIGGDICSIELNGFMHGFVKPELEDNVATINQSKNTIKLPEKNQNERTEETTETTYRESLDPDQNMPDAPTD